MFSSQGYECRFIGTGGPGSGGLEKGHGQIIPHSGFFVKFNFHKTLSPHFPRVNKN